MLLLRSIVRTEGVTAIVATHDPMMLDVADRVVELRDGTLIETPPLTAEAGWGPDQNIVEHHGGAIGREQPVGGRDRRPAGAPRPARPRARSAKRNAPR